MELDFQRIVARFPIPQGNAMGNSLEVQTYNLKEELHAFKREKVEAPSEPMKPSCNG